MDNPPNSGLKGQFGVSDPQSDVGGGGSNAGSDKQAQEFQAAFQQEQGVINVHLQYTAAYAEASALVFPSTCESFGIPAVEAMAQGIPVALADSTALPEIGGEAGWYFDPRDEEAIAGALRELLGRHAERDRRVEVGRAIAQQYRWQAANDRLVEALRT